MPGTVSYRSVVLAAKGAHEGEVAAHQEASQQNGRPAAHKPATGRPPVARRAAAPSTSFGSVPRSPMRSGAPNGAPSPGSPSRAPYSVEPQAHALSQRPSSASAAAGSSSAPAPGSPGWQDAMGRKAKKGYGQLAKENSWLRRELHFLRIRLQNVHKEHAMKTTRMQKDLDHMRRKAQETERQAATLNNALGGAKAAAEAAESQQAALVEEIPQLLARNAALAAQLASRTTDAAHLQELLESLEAQLDQVTCERDALLADISKANGYVMSADGTANWADSGSQFGDSQYGYDGASLPDGGGSQYQSDNDLDDDPVMAELAASPMRPDPSHSSLRLADKPGSNDIASFNPFE